MGYQELIEALRSEGEEKIRTIRQEAEAEAETLRTKAAGEIERIRAEHDRQQSRAVADLSGEALAEALAGARAIRLRAEQELSGRMRVSPGPLSHGFVMTGTRRPSPGGSASCRNTPGRSRG